MVGSGNGAAQGELTCFGAPATIVGTEGNDQLFGTPGPDVIVTLGGDDSVFGLAGDDRICLGPGDDILHPLGAQGRRRVEREHDPRAVGTGRPRVRLDDLDVVDLVDEHGVREEVVQHDGVLQEAPFRFGPAAEIRVSKIDVG